VTLVVESVVSAGSVAGPNWLRVGRIEEIGLGQGRCFKIGERQIAVFRPRGGELRAIGAVCPHRAGPLAQGVVGRDIVICPFHGFKFSLVDGHGLDNDFSIASYRVEVRGSEIFVELR
jgi:nitrite reductase (NADH) small subunit